MRSTIQTLTIRVTRLLARQHQIKRLCFGLLCDGGPAFDANHCSDWRVGAGDSIRGEIPVLTAGNDTKRRGINTMSRCSFSYRK